MKYYTKLKLYLIKDAKKRSNILVKYNIFKHVGKNFFFQPRIIPDEPKLISFGDNVCVDELIKYEWERIPHFFYNFYVYKYATGLSAACYIVTSLLDGKITKEDYINFLKCGKSKSPLDSLKVAGVDLSDKSVIESAINMFDSIIDDFNKLYFE